MESIIRTRRRKFCGWIGASLYILFFSLSLFLFFQSVYPVQPTEKEPLILYSNQLCDDLRQVFKRSIDSARHSIVLIIFSFTDTTLLHSMQKKALEGIDVSIFYDADQNRQLPDFFVSTPHLHLYPLVSRGFMHQKILIIDQKIVWIGSTNFTSSSLRNDANILAGICLPEMAKELYRHSQHLFYHSSIQKQSFISSSETSVQQGKQTFVVGRNRVRIYLLPEAEGAKNRLLSLIRESKKSLWIQMFTWTDQEIAEEVVRAHQRGVWIEIVIDRQLGRGVGRKVVEKLCSSGIPVYLSGGVGLLHYKWACIDGERLLMGSANWTKQAFSANQDIYLEIENLSPRQRSQLQKIVHINRCLASDSL